MLSLYNPKTTCLVYGTNVHQLDTLAVRRCGAMAWTQANDAFDRASVHAYSDGRVNIVDRGLPADIVDRLAGGVAQR